MRYDDYDDYSGRSSRNSGRRSSSSYDRGRSYDRDYRSYDRDYDRDYDRGYDRYSDYDRYDGRRRRDTYEDVDLSGWERTAPDWEDRSAARKKRPSSASSGRNRRPASGSDRSRSASERSRSGQSGDRRRYPEDRQRRDSGRGRSRYDERDRGRNNSRRRSDGRGVLQFVPIIVGIVVIILAALVIRSMLVGQSGYTMTFSSDSIVLGETATATLTNEENTAATAEPEVQWTSSDNNVVSVEGTGLTATLTGKSLGSASITASIDGEKVASKTATVVEVAPGVTAIRVSQDEITVRSGETYAISATVVMESEDMTAATITWTSDNTSVATVDDNGLITAREVGSAIIKGSAGGKTVEVAVTVVENPNSTPYDSTQDAGQAEEGTEDTTGDTGTAAGTNENTTDTGTAGSGTTDTETTDTGSADAGTTTGDSSTEDAGTTAEGTGTSTE